ncbi:uncharacterized protein C19orf44 homolog isoform X2 [Dasypus novemcinctus]|uniref:uncharacterized protein C19orf44 homolog isoform X2 n=1 Tax=Dasypus novemcinctus TaxID=9361 RepID=UPI00265E32AA|nr:uncharacterized protein C19orf44 homolog isoform X2 [Dasypus novemcinctus]
MEGRRGRRLAPASRTGHPVGLLSGDSSDVSSDASKPEETRNAGACRGPLGLPLGQGPVLRRPPTRAERCLHPRERPAGPSPGAPATPASRARAAAALSRLARLESRILRRRARGASPASSPGDSAPEGAAGTFQKHAREVAEPESDGHGGRASRFLKKKEPPAARAGTERNVPTPRPKEPARTPDSPDSDEEEMKVLLGSPTASSSEKEAPAHRGSAGSHASARAPAGRFSARLPALPGEERSSTGLPRRPRPPSADGAFPSAGPGAPSPPAGPLSTPAPSTEGRVTPASPPGQSEATSEASSESLEDFRINVLSLDDLPPAAGESAELETRGEDTQWERPSSPGLRERAPSGPSCAQGASEEGSEEGLSTESAVSELPSGRPAPSSQSSAASGQPSASGGPTASTVSSAYSDDFEASPSPTASEPGGRSEESSDAAPEPAAELPSSLQSDLPRRPRGPRRTGARDAPGVTVRETAVQTLEPAFSHPWESAAGVEALGPAPGGAYVDPMPIASHIVSTDTIEALLTHSPAAHALNELLRQQLSLTRWFMESSRQLRGSALRALDEDTFHYHTLEEAREYIRHHRPAPLTLEDALQQVRGGERQ